MEIQITALVKVVLELFLMESFIQEVINAEISARYFVYLITLVQMKKFLQMHIRISEPTDSLK